MSTPYDPADDDVTTQSTGGSSPADGATGGSHRESDSGSRTDPDASTHEYHEGIFEQGQPEPDGDIGQGVFEQGHPAEAGAEGQGIFKQGRPEPPEEGAAAFDQDRPDESGSGSGSAH